MTRDAVWMRSRRCESHACPEWQVADGLVRLRSSERPAMVAELTVAELDALMSAHAAGEVVVGEG